MMEVHIYIETDSKAPQRQLRKYGNISQRSSASIDRGNEETH